MTSRNALCCCTKGQWLQTYLLNCLSVTLMLNCKMVDLWFSRRGGQYWQLVLALKANKGDRGFLSMLSKEASHKLVGCMIKVHGGWEAPSLKCVVPKWALPVREGGCKGLPGWFRVFFSPRPNGQVLI